MITYGRISTAGIGTNGGLAVVSATCLGFAGSVELEDTESEPVADGVLAVSSAIVEGDALEEAPPGLSLGSSITEGMPYGLIGCRLVSPFAAWVSVGRIVRGGAGNSGDRPASKGNLTGASSESPAGGESPESPSGGMAADLAGEAALRGESAERSKRLLRGGAEPSVAAAVDRLPKLGNRQMTNTITNSTDTLATQPRLRSQKLSLGGVMCRQIRPSAGRPLRPNRAAIGIKSRTNCSGVA